jgi:DNA invertase Pin-like site-specific DNA recombinase
LSRLTRDTKFLLTLVDGSVDVVFADLPQLPLGAQGKFFLTMMAAVAELEAGLTSERTKAALAQVKARGEKRLGNPTNLAEAQRRGAASMKAAADAFAARVLPTIHDIQRHGAPSLRAIAATLNARGIPTSRGGTWSAMQVLNVLQRAQDKVASDA